MDRKIITEGQFITVPVWQDKALGPQDPRIFGPVNSSRHDELCLTEQAIGPIRKWWVAPIAVPLLPSQLTGFTAELVNRDEA